MREVMTTTMARNIFYGGSLFFILIFLGLSVHSYLYVVNTATAAVQLTDSVARGKRVWEDNACIKLPYDPRRGCLFRARGRQRDDPLGRRRQARRCVHDAEGLDRIPTF